MITTKRKTHNECNVLESPSPPGSVEKRSSTNPVPGARKFGECYSRGEDMVLDSAIFRCVASGTLLNISEPPFTVLKNWWLSGKEPACRGRRRRFHPWVRTFPRRRKRHPTPVFLPGKSHGQGSLAGCSPRGHKESDTTERRNSNRTGRSSCVLGWLQRTREASSSSSSASPGSTRDLSSWTRDRTCTPGI